VRRYAARVGFVAAIVVAAAAAGPTEAGLSEAEVRDLTVTRAAEGYRVTYLLDGAFPEEVLERLHSGITVSFRHKLRLVGKRPFPLWPPKELGRTIVVTTANYDSLTRQYQLTRTVETDARGIKGKILTDPENRATSDLEEVEAWMTDVRDVLMLVPVRDPESARRVEVNSVLGRRWILGMFPAQYTASADQELER